MITLRKAALPTALAAGFLAFLAAVGPGGTTTVSAAPLDVCQVNGPTAMGVGQKADFTAIVADANTGQTTHVDLNDQRGDSDITSLNGATIPVTDHLSDVPLTAGANVCGTSDTDLMAQTLATNKAFFRAFILDGLDRGEVCSGLPPLSVAACQQPSPGESQGSENGGGPLWSFPYNDHDIDCGLVPVLNDQCSINTTIINAVVDAIAQAKASGTNSCATLGTTGEDAALLAGATEFVASQFEDFIQDDCTGIGANTPDGRDGYITVDVTCDRPGIFDLSFAPDGGGARSIEVVCAGDVETAEIFSTPTTVEINPSLANVAHSLVWVSLKGKDGEVAIPGTKVLFTTDRCSIESSTVSNENDFEAAEGLFRSINPLNPATAQAVEQSTFATTAPDGASRQQEEPVSFGVTSSPATGNVERTVAAVVLHCDPIHAPSVTPGPATVTAYIERGSLNDGNIANDDDLVLKTTVTVVGPPAANGVTVTAAPSTLACGEKATITADVKDSIGQPVSDHTLVEAVTNAGGVLAGTGAVAGQAGLVSPVSSTIAETFGGKATFYLLTSTAHVGKYEVVVTTGGGGGVTGQLANGGVSTNLLGGLFTTAPISVQVTVECSVPSVAPVVAAPSGPSTSGPSTSGPSTGQGIRPPSTGDAGLAAAGNHSSWVIGAGVAAVVAVLSTAVALKPRRLED